VEELRYITANGLRFAFYERGAGPLLLLLHGFPDTADTWRGIWPELAAAGYRVVAPFMRGYPPTEAPADGDYSSLGLGRDVLALIAAFGERSAVVVGHDWGALAAYAAANLAPESLEALVTLAIPHPGSLRFSPAALLKARHFITFQLGGWAVERLKRDDFAEIDAIYRRWSPGWAPTGEDLAPVKRAFSTPGAVEAALGYYWSFRKDALSLGGARVRRVLRAKTRVPTLAFFGEDDGALDQGGVALTRAFFAGRYEIVRLPNVGHFIQREAAPVFIDKTLRFLRATPPRP
jgi:pimeloyl-ACP methyl ester carboxylesterase